ncbi:MAG: DNA-processing protein DprA [Bacteroidales bacterium]|nr:DNA-processing protein DprA [Bacteroidales bacterium]
MDNFEEKAAACTLNRLFGFKPAIARTLTGKLGSAAAVFRLSREEKEAVFGPGSPYPDKLNQEELDQSAAELEWLRKEGFHFIIPGDGIYPDALLECPDAPAGLYLRSDNVSPSLFNAGVAVSIVGTRDISPYGREWTYRIVEALADSLVRPTVVSGLALGVDGAAHEAALELGLPTIGVMATGIESVYPRMHSPMAARMARTPGCALVTDYPPFTSPQAVNFLRRNRIIAGLSKATVLVESKIKGGGLLTANLAFEYDREVFALPGRADDIRSEGCNRIIREKIAEPLTDLGAFVKGLGLGLLTRRNKAVLEEEISRVFSLSESEEDVRKLQQVAALIKKNRGITLDEICAGCGMDYKDARRYTGMLETEGIIYTDLLQRCSIVFKNA